jgi:beta-1,2-mannobiose phosphorylase / 1,2-beta-oligomannan phosphorylase
VTKTVSLPHVRRCLDGAPILAPTERRWESGVTFNAAVTYLANSDANHALLTRLLAGTVYHHPRSADGLVVVHYRARPKTDPDYLITRSYVGLALFSVDLELIYRFPEPVVQPGTSKTDPDYLGVEDPRVTTFSDKFVMVYCGSGLDAAGEWTGSLCAAESTDLLHWRKTGVMPLRFANSDGRTRFDDSYFDNLAGAHGTANQINNKDGVLFPGRVGDSYYLLHRPMLGEMSGWAIHLARSDSLVGPWLDLGPMMRAAPHAGYQDTWPGAGAVPLDLGGGRFLEIYHSGHRAANGSRLYTLGAALLNFNLLEPSRPESLVEARLDHFMVPETSWEIEGPYPDSVGNVLFSCGAFERDGEITILYGGGDTYVMAAKIRTADLLDALKPVNSVVDLPR